MDCSVTWDLLCGPGWPQTCNGLLSSASWVPRWQTNAIMPGSFYHAHGNLLGLLNLACLGTEDLTKSWFNSQQVIKHHIRPEFSSTALRPWCLSVIWSQNSGANRAVTGSLGAVSWLYVSWFYWAWPCHELCALWGPDGAWSASLTSQPPRLLRFVCSRSFFLTWSSLA